MTPDELHSELGSGALRPAYLIAGEEPLLRDDALAELRGAVLGEGAQSSEASRMGEPSGPDRTNPKKRVGGAGYAAR